MKSGFVNIFGPPNAGKSTLLNALLGQELAITSPKVQTTRHRILGILTEDDYQIIFSDTPGIIQPKYKLHEKMMKQLDNALEDTDVALLMVDINEDPKEFAALIADLKIKGKRLLLVNKIDTLPHIDQLQERLLAFKDAVKAEHVMGISALQKINIQPIIDLILEYLPEGMPFYSEEDISDRPVRFFVSELIRQQIYNLYDKELPYHTAVLIQSFEEKKTLTKIRADIICTRETQKMIIIGKNGEMIRKLGTRAREKIEDFLERKVFLELFVKVRPKWRENNTFLKEYGY
ncbi:MAG: GTPase Era [Taibaiella sp.]|nr:GTPase Era [Taibaiella sp.]